MTLSAGGPSPLGAHWNGDGVNFAVASRTATAIELCLFSADGAREQQRLALPARTDDVWHGFLPGAAPGLVYGLRTDGPWAPERGECFDPAKLLVDPHARALVGRARFDESLCSPPGGPDTAALVPRCLVIDPAFEWQGDTPPRIPWSRSVLYECHVKGMTALHPLVPELLRGRYLGLAEPAVIEHLQQLGVTALQLMPVHQSCVDAHLGRLGLPNYWGYGTLGFFAPDARFASGDRGEQLREFKEMVRRLHASGIEVLLDVVYNHTPETDGRGATWSLRGLDEGGYYRMKSTGAERLEDFTGCGNSLDGRKPRVQELVLESLRYWVRDMHVDGFRFDLAPVLARGDDALFSASAPLLEAIASDPLLESVKLVAEPWDLGPEGDCSGAFPPGFAEWNGRYRDDARRFWRGEAGARTQLAKRLAGSEDLFAWNGRRPQSSINFVTCHDGFTLKDLVSYAQKRNAANGEENRDGRDDEGQWDFGAPADSSDPEVRRLRELAKRNLVATLAFSQGVPMLSHGDELGRSQSGNNNAYCQDSELTWVDWNVDDGGLELLAFFRQAFALRRSNAVFRRQRFFRGECLPSGTVDISWLGPDGLPLTESDWGDASLSLAVVIPREAADPHDEHGLAACATSALILFNGGEGDVQFAMPAASPGDPPGEWLQRLASHEGLALATHASDNLAAHEISLPPGRAYSLAGHGIALFEWCPDDASRRAR